jgi:arylsulfatase A-like enzyme
LTSRILGLVFLVQLGCRSACSAERAPRHAILITVDTLRADRLGAYGHAAAHTPNLDGLAATSLRFDRAYAHSSMTVPSISSLFTGLLPSEHGIYTNDARLRPGLRSLAEVLQGAGFTTAAFVGSYALRPDRGLDRGFATYTQQYGARERMRGHPENLAGPLTDAAVAWLAERGDGEQLFLWVHYQEPHGPYTPPRFETPEDEGSASVMPRGANNSGRGAIPRFGHGRLAEYQARYDGEIAEFDRHLGRLLDALREREILDRSVLVLTSDHGEAFGEEGLFCAHGEGLGEPLLRVPLLLRGEVVPAGVRQDRVRLIDVATTMLGLLDLPETGFAGTSLLSDEGDRTLVAQVRSLNNEHWRSLRDGDLELRQNAGHESELRREGGDALAAQTTREQSATRAELHAQLEARAPWPGPQPTVKLSDEERDALRALGYVD